MNFVCVSGFETVIFLYEKILSTFFVFMATKGESNGKLLLRTCPGCSVPEP
jgi:hypothetical protein